MADIVANINGSGVWTLACFKHMPEILFLMLSNMNVSFSFFFYFSNISLIFSGKI